MGPFQEFRGWLRGARQSERVTTALAAVLAFAALGWLMVPARPDDAMVTEAGTAAVTADGTAASGDSPTGQDVAVPGAAAPNGGAAAAPGAAGGSSAGARSATTAKGAAAAAAAARETASRCPAQVDERGTTKTKLRMAVALVNIAGPGANETFGVPSVADQRKYYEIVIGEVNATGGAGCRQIVPQWFEMNPADRSQANGTCIDIAEADVMGVLDAGAGFMVQECFGRSKIPFFSTVNLTVDSERRRYYPYLFSFGTLNTVFHDAVVGLAARGFFDKGKGFRKLGYIYDSCKAEIHTSVLGWLREAKVASTDVVTYDVGCTSPFTSPSNLQQAILKFREAGVTHVTSTMNPGDFANFTKTAQQQRFRPVYGLGDNSLIAGSDGIRGPDPDNLDGATVITTTRYGEETTPGSKPSAGTQRCNAIYAKAGMPPLYEQSTNFGGIICNQLWMFQAAVERAGELRRTALAGGLQATRAIDFSYPHGPGDFTQPRTTTAGQFYRVAKYVAACGCWRVVDPVFKRGF